MSKIENGILSITWNITDIILRANENGINITEEQALEVLEQLMDEHDCNTGINWDVIDYCLGTRFR